MIVFVLGIIAGIMITIGSILAYYYKTADVITGIYTDDIQMQYTKEDWTERNDGEKAQMGTPKKTKDA